MCVIMDQGYKEANVDLHYEGSKNSTSPLSKIPTKKNASCLPRPVAFPCNSDMPSERRPDSMWYSKQDMWTELCRLRQENIRLQKEVAAKEKEAFNFREKVLSVTKENTTLMEELSRITLDNHKLKMRVIAVMEENDTLHSKLSRPPSSFRTYPWSESTCPDGKNCTGLAYIKAGSGKNFFEKYQSEISSDWKSRKVTQTESWEAVSQKLLMQMKQEMEELEDLGNKLAVEAGATAIEDAIDDHASDSMFSSCNNDFSDDENCIKVVRDMKDQSAKIKQLLQSQNKILKEAMQNVICPRQRNVTPTESFAHNDYQEEGEDDKGQTSLEVQKFLDNRLRFSRPSDESFRAYFKQQLSGSTEWAMKKPIPGKDLNLHMEPDRDQRPNEISKGTISKNGFQDTKTQDCILGDTSISNLVLSKSHKFSEEERVCPVCQVMFPHIMSQNEYEIHVMAHFEEHISLVQQYEVV